MKTTYKLTWALALVILFAFVAAAQVTNTVVVIPGPVIPGPVLVNLWNGLIVLVVPLLVLAIKKVLPSLPKITWPILAAVIGILADWMLAKAGALTGSSWELGALCGAAGVGLREAIKQAMVLTGVGDEPAKGPNFDA